jgi:hypothetical protein
MTHDFKAWIADQMQDIVFIASEKVIQAYYFIALIQQPFTEMRAKKSCSAGD